MYRVAYAAFAAIVFLSGCEREKKVSDESQAWSETNFGTHGELAAMMEDSAAPASASDHLKPLAWLVGKWIDKNDDISVKLSYHWDPSHHFLIQRFSMQSSHEKPIQGVQILGWDPLKERIRSWIFDSRGGFGEGVWSEDEDHWYVRIYFTLADGQKASAIHILTQLDENTYSFEAENRDLNGRLFPNLGPFKVVREKDSKW